MHHHLNVLPREVDIYVCYFFFFPTQGFLKAFQISQRDIMTFEGNRAADLFFFLFFFKIRNIHISASKRHNWKPVVV